MKTSVNAIAMPLAGSLDELVFSNRNQAYGAYELRKRYNKRLFFGFLFGCLFFGVGVSVPLIRAMMGPSVVAKPEKDISITLSDPKFDEIIPPTPPPPPINDAQVRFVPPVVVDSVLLDEGEIQTIDESLARAENGFVTEAPLEPVATTDPIELDPALDQGTWQVEESATFMGGDVNTFRLWVQKNLIYPQAAAEAGIGARFNVIFSVNRNGEVCDVKFQREIHPSLREETARVLMSSPKWTPAKQNGRPTKQNFAMPLIFKIE